MFITEKKDWVIQRFGKCLKDELNKNNINKINITSKPFTVFNKVMHFGSQYMWTEDANSPYAWFDTDKDEWYLQHIGTGIREYI